MVHDISLNSHPASSRMHRVIGQGSIDFNLPLCYRSRFYNQAIIYYPYVVRLVEWFEPPTQHLILVPLVLPSQIDHHFGSSMLNLCLEETHSPTQAQPLRNVLVQNPSCKFMGASYSHPAR